MAVFKPATKVYLIYAETAHASNIETIPLHKKPRHGFLNRNSSNRRNRLPLLRFYRTSTHMNYYCAQQKARVVCKRGHNTALSPRIWLGIKKEQCLQYPCVNRTSNTMTDLFTAGSRRLFPAISSCSTQVFHSSVMAHKPDWLNSTSVPDVITLTKPQFVFISDAVFQNDILLQIGICCAGCRFGWRPLCLTTLHEVASGPITCLWTA